MSSNSRFRYALQPVLLTRQWELDALLQDLADINNRLAGCRQAVAQLTQQMQDVSSAWQAENAQGASLTPDRFALVTRYLGDLAAQRQQREQQLTAIEQQREEMIDRVAKARRALDAAEEHRDAELVKFNREQASGQFKDADDQWSNAQTGRHDD